MVKISRALRLDYLCLTYHPRLIWNTLREGSGPHPNLQDKQVRKKNEKEVCDKLVDENPH